MTMPALDARMPTSVTGWCIASAGFVWGLSVIAVEGVLAGAAWTAARLTVVAMVQVFKAREALRRLIDAIRRRARERRRRRGPRMPWWHDIHPAVWFVIVTMLTFTVLVWST